MHGNDSESSVNGVRAALRHKYAPVKEALLPILVLARERIAIYLAEAVAAEEEFFSTFDLPREQTALARLHDIALAKIHSEIVLRDGSGPSRYTGRTIPNIQLSEPEEIFNWQFKY